MKFRIGTTLNRNFPGQRIPAINLRGGSVPAPAGRQSSNQVPRRNKKAVSAWPVFLCPVIVLALAMAASAQDQEVKPGTISDAGSTENSASNKRTDGKISAPAQTASNSTAIQDLLAPEQEAGDSLIAKDELIREINAIRQQLGGGIGAHLGEIFQDRMPQSFSRKQLQSDFETELRRLNSSSPSGPSSPISANLKSGSRFNAAVNNRYASPPTSPTKPDVLRRVARKLESAAADLEVVGRYRDADELRAKAGRLWSAARGSSYPELPINASK